MAELPKCRAAEAVKGGLAALGAHGGQCVLRIVNHGQVARAVFWSRI